MKATWNGAVVAESDNTIVIEGNHYFPPDSLNRAYLVESDHHTTCPWKGYAHYVHVDVDGSREENGGWFYPDPKPAASEIKDHVAFWKGVEVVG